MNDQLFDNFEKKKRGRMEEEKLSAVVKWLLSVFAKLLHL